MSPKKGWCQYSEEEKTLMRQAVVNANSDTPFPPKYAAAYLGKSLSTLQHMRCHQTDGIKYIKVGGHIIYRRRDLDEYLDKYG